MTARSPLPADLAERSFTVAEALALGVPASRLRAGDFRRPFHGTRTTLPEPEDEFGESRLARRAREYAPRLREGQFFAGGTALAMLGVALPPAYSRYAGIEVAVLAPRRAIRSRGVTGHELKRARVLIVDGLPVQHPVDAWALAGSGMSRANVILLGDGLLRRDSPLATLDELCEAVAARAGGRGVRVLADALPRIRPGTDSPRETVVRCALVDAGLPEPQVNFVIRDAFGRFLGLGDMVYPDQRIVVEYDGGYHFDDPEQRARDIDRVDAMMAAGWRVIRVTNEHVRDGLGQIVERVRRALQAADAA